MAPVATQDSRQYDNQHAASAAAAHLHPGLMHLGRTVVLAKSSGGLHLLHAQAALVSLMLLHNRRLQRHSISTMLQCQGLLTFMACVR
jgi:hypothetical protein